MIISIVGHIALTFCISIIQSKLLFLTVSFCENMTKCAIHKSPSVDSLSPPLFLGYGILFSLQISNLIFDSSLQSFRPEFVHHSCLKSLGQGNFRFAQFLVLNTRLTTQLICLFVRNNRDFDFCQIASIMVFDFLNSNLCALILKDWIMITLFCTCLFPWWIWS